MSETCHPGIAYILQLYTEEQSRVDTALTHNVCHTSKEDGMRGMELPYQLRSDWMVTSVLFLCFIPYGSSLFIAKYLHWLYSFFLCHQMDSL